MSEDRVVFNSLGGEVLVQVNGELQRSVALLQNSYQAHTTDSTDWRKQSWNEVEKRMQSLSSKVALRRKEVMIKPVSKSNENVASESASKNNFWSGEVSYPVKGKLESLYYHCFLQQLETVHLKWAYNHLLKDIALSKDITLVHLISEIWDMVSGNIGCLRYIDEKMVIFEYSQIRFSGRMKSSDTDEQIILGLEKAIAAKKSESLQRLNENIRMTGSFEVGIGVSLLSNECLKKLFQQLLLMTDVTEYKALQKYVGSDLFNQTLVALGISKEQLEEDYQDWNRQSFLMKDKQYTQFLENIKNIY